MGQKRKSFEEGEKPQLLLEIEILLIELWTHGILGVHPIWGSVGMP